MPFFTIFEITNSINLNLKSKLTFFEKMISNTTQESKAPQQSCRRRNTSSTNHLGLPSASHTQNPFGMPLKQARASVLPLGFKLINDRTVEEDEDLRMIEEEVFG